MFGKGTVGTNDSTVNSEVLFREKKREERSAAGHGVALGRLEGEHVILRSMKRFLSVSACTIWLLLSERHEIGDALMWSNGV